LLVDPDTPNAFKVTSKSLQTITRRNREILQPTSLIDHTQLSPGPVLDVPGELSRALASVNPFSLGVAEAFEHR
jgi:hypothetical protein